MLTLLLRLYSTLWFFILIPICIPIIIVRDIFRDGISFVTIIKDIWGVYNG